MIGGDLSTNKKVIHHPYEGSISIYRGGPFAAILTNITA
jgi:hypothetical protein